MKRSLFVLPALAAMCGCGDGGAAATPPLPRAGAPQLELEQLPRERLPGVQVRGDFRVPGRGAVGRAWRLVATGSGTRRTALLIAPGRHGELCFAGVIGARARRASFTCLERWDRPPMLVRAAVGGESRRATDWMALVGLARMGVARVSAESQRGETLRPRLRSWRGFPWKAFAVPPARRGAFPSTVFAGDSSRAVQDVGLGWAYGAACGEQNAPRCTPRRLRAGRWSAVRDPIARSQSSFVQRSGGRRAKRLAFSHPVVLTLVARQAFAIGSVAEWSRCNGRPIGAIVPIVLSRPTDFEGEVPVQGTDDTNRYAYLEGVAQMRVQNGVSFDVYVDLNRHKVVGIMARVRVPGSGVDPMPEVDVRPIGELRPAGGPAAGNCVQQGD